MKNHLSRRSPQTSRLRRFSLRGLFVGATLLAAAGQATAANYGLTATDNAGNSSFTSGFNPAFRLNSVAGNPATAPTAGNDYATNAFALRAPANTTSYSFLGDSLTVSPGGRFLFKSTGTTAGTTQVITVNNLILSGGVVDLAADGTGANLATLAGNATLTSATTSFFGALPAQRLTVSSTIGGSGALTISGPSVNGGGDTGTVILTGANNYTGTTTIAGGTLVIGAGGATGSLLGTGSIVNNANLTFNRTGTITQGTDFGSVISGTGNLNQIGAGSALVLNGANTYSGQTSIFSGGSISVSSLNSVVGGTASSNLGTPNSVANGTILLGGNGATGTLIYTGAGETSDRAVRMSAFSAGSNGVIDQSGTGALVLSGGITNNSGATHVITLQGSTASTGEISGVIANGTGLALTKAGTGTWTLSNTNTYTGATTVNGGTLGVTATGALGSTTAVAVNAGGTLLLSGSNTVTTRVNDAATVNLNGGRFALNNVAEGSTGAGAGAVGVGALTLSGNSVIDLQGTSLLHLAASGSQTWTGTLSIYNWTGSTTGGSAEQLLFGLDDSATSLTSTQLGQIVFYSGDGTGFLGTAQFAGMGDGEIVPAVPEPSTWAAGLLGLALLGYTQRRRASGWLRIRRAA